MMLTKKFLKTKCKVTFELPSALAQNAHQVFLVGDFNNWSHDTHPMELKKDGRYVRTVDLGLNGEYRYRYLVNGEWHNDWQADKYVPNEFGVDNSVVTTYTPNND